MDQAYGRTYTRFWVLDMTSDIDLTKQMINVTQMFISIANIFVDNIFDAIIDLVKILIWDFPQI